MKIQYKSMFVALSAAMILTACSSDHGALEHAGHGSAHQVHAANGDLQELTASVDIAPSFLDGQPEQVRLVYAAAGKARDILQWMPCYCGCGESAGHTSNLNCFLKEVREDGSAVWDDHGTRCGVCLQIAVESINLKQEGLSLKEIRDHIDRTYTKGYAKPTDTAMPQ